MDSNATPEEIMAAYPAVPKLELDPETMEKLWMGNVFPIMLAANQTARWDIAFGAILAANAMFDLNGQDQLVSVFHNIQEITKQLQARATLGTSHFMELVGLDNEKYKSIVPRIVELQKKQQENAAANTQQ